MVHFRIIYIMLLDYNYWYINVFITLMLQLVKVELILTILYIAG